jgi:site-specific DNA recombinase
MENLQAVIYARYSSSSQREASIEDQIRECKAFAKANKMSVVKVYSDYAITGTTDDRANFQLMIKQAAKKVFQVVLIYKNDRFARNRFDAAIYKKKLKTNGIKVIAIREPIPDGPGGIVMEALYESMAEMYSANLAENIHRGQKGNAMKCMANCMAPFGYKIDPNTRHYIENKETSPILKEIFRMAAGDNTYTQIIDFLKTKGYDRSPNWLYRTLKNKRYLGFYIYKDVEIKNGMPQLISQELFNAVATKLKLRERLPKSKPDEYLLSQKLFCGYCQKMMIGEYAIDKHKRKHRYYVCPGKKRTKDCSSKRLNADLVEKRILLAIKEDILNPETIKKLAKDAIAYQEKEFQEESEANALTAELKEINHKINNMLKAIESGIVTESIRSRAEELEAQKKELLRRISAEQLKAPLLSENDLITFLNGCKDMMNNETPKTNKSLINTFVSKVFVFKDYATLIYNTNPEAETRITLEEVRGSTMEHQWWR